MKNHEAEELHDELITETKDHAATLREWEKDVGRCNALQAEVAQLKQANAELVKAFSKHIEEIHKAVSVGNDVNWEAYHVANAKARQAIDAAITKGTV